MSRVKSLKPYDWNQKPMPANVEHDATEQEAQLLEALGWAQRVRYGEGTYQTRVMTAERPSPTPSHLPRPNRQQRRQLARRDMVAARTEDTP